MTSLIEIYRRFPTKEDAIAHLEVVRWPDGPTCPQCGADLVATNHQKPFALVQHGHGAPPCGLTIA